MQNLKSLKAHRTIKVEDKNHFTWHKGVEQYGFWAVLIRDPAWIEAYNRARSHVSNLVLPNYLRTPHITLSACGLVSEQHFSAHKLRHQKDAISKLAIKPFYIEQHGLDSFETAPFISISAKEELSIIRRVLESIHQDNPSQNYVPHLTLGFYREFLPLVEIQGHLMNYSPPDLPPLLVESIAYCQYQTSGIQGEISIEYEQTLPSHESIENFPCKHR